MKKEETWTLLGECSPSLHMTCKFELRSRLLVRCRFPWNRNILRNKWTPPYHLAMASWHENRNFNLVYDFDFGVVFTLIAFLPGHGVLTLDFTIVFILTIITWPWCIGARRGSLTPELLKISFISSVRWWTNLEQYSIMLGKNMGKKRVNKEISFISSVRFSVMSFSLSTAF